MRHIKLMLFICGGLIIFVAVNSALLSPRGTASHVIAAIGYHNQAAAIANKDGSAKIISAIPPDDWAMIYELDKRALDEGRRADISEMNKHYPAFGDHFRVEFIEGENLIVENCNHSANSLACLNGQLLVDRFGDWYGPNESAIRNSTQN